MGKLRGALVDLDGTVYLGDKLIPGADTAITTLEAAGVEPVFLSNNATKRPVEYREKLANLGIDVELDRILNSAAIAADYLSTTHPDARTYVIGEASLRAELQAADVEVVDEPDGVDIVLASMCRDFDYGMLQDVLDADREAVLDADRGAETHLYATNPDRTCPVEDGEVPDCGPIIGAIEGLLGREIDGVLGKPSQVTIDVALDRLGLAPDECVMIGDRLETDIRMGERAGMQTALVCTGVTDRSHIPDADVEPDHVLDSIADVGGILT